MYDKISAATGMGVVTTGGLAFTGVNIMWAVLSGFALLAAGFALLRISPRRRRQGVKS